MHFGTLATQANRQQSSHIIVVCCKRCSAAVLGTLLIHYKGNPAHTQQGMSFCNNQAMGLGQEEKGQLAAWAAMQKAFCACSHSCPSHVVSAAGVSGRMGCCCVSASRGEPLPQVELSQCTGSQWVSGKHLPQTAMPACQQCQHVQHSTRLHVSFLTHQWQCKAGSSC